MIRALVVCIIGCLLWVGAGASGYAQEPSIGQAAVEVEKAIRSAMSRAGQAGQPTLGQLGGVQAGASGGDAGGGRGNESGSGSSGGGGGG